MKLEVESRQLDDKRRLIMPEDCPPRSAVTISQVDADTWVVKRHRPEKGLVVIALPIIQTLPADHAWEKVESAYVKAANKGLTPPDFE